MNFQNFQSQILKLRKQLDSEQVNEDTRIKYLGKNGLINYLSQQLKDLSVEDRKPAGQLLNELKHKAKTLFSLRIKHQTSTHDWFDLTQPIFERPLGHYHPVNQMIREMNAFFKRYGFSVVDGPEIETEEFNFQKLNLPPDHPARDLQDTLYIEEPNILLRTHTSSVEARILAQYPPPLRVVIPGKVYRHETVNASNNVMFFQYQAVAVDRQINLANLRWVLEAFVKHFYGADQETRFRCKYYPEVEPTAGMDLACKFCHKQGCAVCKGRGWLEVLGCGMIHPKILQMANIDPLVWSGFAWGMGLDRLVMSKYNIPDVRALTDGSITYPYS